MILDYNYSKNKKEFSISYVKDNGAKDIYKINVTRFKSFYEIPGGKYKNWNGKDCEVRWVDKPDWAAEKYFIRSLEKDSKIPEDIKKLIFEGKSNPKLYTFDIETYIPDDNVFPDPAEAKFPITTISCCSPECNVLIMGTKEMIDENSLQEEFNKYVSKTDFFKTLELPTPTIKYIKFETERGMLKYFLKNIVAKAPVLGGWNSLLFDWQYIQNRIRGYYPDIFFNICSSTMTTHRKRYTDRKNNDVFLDLPDHTVLLDMMDVVGSYDMAVMPIKESLSLDYIAHESIGVNKIKYDGTLGELYKTDYDKYVFYNAIDSFLVQLIDKKFKTLDTIYMQARYCKDKVKNCFSKIAISEALVFNYFYDRDIQVVTEGWTRPDRGELVGAYVKNPMAGKHNFVVCNDFASLYPSTIISCNLSFENFMGGINDGTFKESDLQQYRDNPDYFVSVNGNVYKNDRDYAFKSIQSKLKLDRGKSKYLAKDLDATVMLDVEHAIKHKHKKSHIYDERVQEALREIGYNVKSGDDFKDWDVNSLIEFKRKLKDEIIYHLCNELTMKLLGNSMYGGSSHVMFFWFNLFLANDITGEARNIIHKMEHHIPEYFLDWPKWKDVHNQLGIELIDHPEELLKDVKIQENDPDASKVKSYVSSVYGDTDSVVGDTVLKIRTLLGEENITIEDLFEKWVNKGKEIIVTKNGSELIKSDDLILNWDKTLSYKPIKYIMRHKVSKPKWKLKTRSGKEIIVTEDHSLIVFRDGKEIQVKPKDVKKTDKILIIQD